VEYWIYRPSRQEAARAQLKSVFRLRKRFIASMKYEQDLYQKIVFQEKVVRYISSNLSTKSSSVADELTNEISMEEMQKMPVLPASPQEVLALQLAAVAELAADLKRYERAILLTVATSKAYEMHLLPVKSLSLSFFLLSLINCLISFSFYRFSPF
jgi:hypothetical protein